MMGHRYYRSCQVAERRANSRRQSISITEPESELECRLLARAATLQAFNACLARAAREAEAEAADAAADQARLRQQLGAFNQSNSELRSSVAELSADVAATRADLAAAEDAHTARAAATAEEAAQLRAEVAIAKASIAAGLERELRLQKENDEMKMSAADAARKAGEDAADAAAIETQLRQQLSACKQDNSELRSSVTELNADVTAIQRDLAAAHDAHKASAAAADDRAAQLCTEVANAKASIAAGVQRELCLQREVDAQTAAAASAARKAEAVAANAAVVQTQLREQLSTFQRNNAELRGAVAELREDVAAAHADLAAARNAHAASAAAADEREAQLCSEVASAKASIAAGLEQELRLKTQIDEERTNAAKAAREADAEAAIASAVQIQLRQQLCDSQQANDELRSSVAKLTADVTAVQRDLATANDAHSAGAAAAAKWEVQLRREVNSATGAARKAGAEAAAAAAGKARLQHQLSAFQQQNEKLHGVVAKLTAEAAATQADLAASQDARATDAVAASTREAQLRVDMDSAAGAARKARAEAATAATVIVRLQHQVSTCQRDNKKLRSAVAKLTADMAATQADLAAAQDARDITAAAAGEREAQLHDQIAALATRIAAGTEREERLKAAVQKQTANTGACQAAKVAGVLLVAKTSLLCRTTPASYSHH